MEVPFEGQPLKKVPSGKSEANHPIQTALSNGSAATPYALMNNLSKEVPEDKKILYFYKLLADEKMSTNDFLEKFYEAKKINFLMEKKGITKEEAKKTVDDLNAVPPLIRTQREIVFLDEFPTATKKIVTTIIESDPYFKDIPIRLSFNPEYSWIAHVEAQNINTKTIDISIYPFFYFFGKTSQQQIGILMHELMHVKRNHAQIRKGFSQIIQGDLNPLRIMQEYEADLFAAAENIFVAKAIESIFENIN